MSGHSKWHNIQARKGKQDKMKANAFTKVGRMITIAARQGGGDIATNFSLRLAIEKAREVNLPKDNIERAIKKGTGELNDGSTLDQLVYEGFGSGGAAVIVEVLTDNKNRSASEIKHIFATHGGSAAGPNSVQWQFNHLGVIRIAKDKIDGKDELEMALIEAGADDILENEFGLEVRAAIANFQKVLEKVKFLNIVPDEAGLEWVAKEEISLDAEKSAQMAGLYDALDEHDDVRAVYTNEK
jgi:YebC/PmpR family DNA-binding regulatory protein